MKQIAYGTLDGLNKAQINRIENLYTFKSPPEYILSRQAAMEIVEISREIRRQIGILLDRNGKVVCVVAGEPHRIVIPVIPDFQAGPGRLKGLRCVHTHLTNEALTRDDLTDLALLRLDYITAICLNEDGTAGPVYSAHILPDPEADPYRVLPGTTLEDLNTNCQSQILELESELSRHNRRYSPETGQENAFLINAVTQGMDSARVSLDELEELCKTSRINVVGTAIQQRKKIDPKFVVGKGKLSELIIKAIQNYATMLVFDRELSPSQIRSITDFVEMKVIDRTQLILDIFAKQAKSSEGKYQVELAQLEYMLPRLISKNTAMSRLTGGIGGRGPGETKLEVNRRRARERINRLKQEIKKIRKQRTQQKARRKRRNLPVISIVGYTNAGKSTLLNTLTQSSIIAADRLFATLDPSSRRLRFPRDKEVIITDTVGFIQNLPKELLEAFHATLEELEQADVILHVIDISNPRYMQQKETVDQLLKSLNLNKIPSLYVFNKMDQADLENFDSPWLLNQGIVVSAHNKSSLAPLVEKLEAMV